MTGVVHGLAIVAILVVAGAAGAQQWSPEEQAIWELERAYQAVLATGNISKLADYWHEQFVGWPAHSAHPVEKAAAPASLERLLASVTVVSSEVNPRAIALRGSVVLVHYEVVLETVSAEGVHECATYRITHTWVKDQGRWRILGGMSAS